MAFRLDHLEQLLGQFGLIHPTEGGHAEGMPRRVFAMLLLFRSNRESAIPVICGQLRQCGSADGKGDNGMVMESWQTDSVVERYTC